MGNYHKGIIEQHGILYEDRVDAGRLVGGSPAAPVVEVAVFSIDVDIPPEQEDRTITMTTLKTLVSSNKTPIPIRERHT